MGNLGGFDATQVEPATGFDPLPAADYTAVIAESGFQETKAGDGQYLKLTFEIIDGQYKGRKIWTNLNLNNPNAKAVEIAKGQLSAICRAVGVLQPQDSGELHDRPLIIRVKCKKRPDTGDIQNEISSYKATIASSTMKLGAAAATPSAPAATAAPASSTPPWGQQG